MALCLAFCSITSATQIQLIMKRFLITAVSTFIIVTGCSSFIYGIFCKREGIEGYVYKVSGNQMPSPDIKRPAPKGIKTTIYIYELTNIKQVKSDNRSSLYSAISSKLVKTIESNSKGYFKASLPAGKYSVFTKEGDLFYANLFDQDNNIAPVEVLRKKRTKIEIKMDHGAVY